MTKKYHFLFLGNDFPARVSWSEHQADGRIIVGHGSLADAGHLQGENVVVVVPGPDVLLTEVSFGGNRSRFVKRSIPYALEENLAEDIDDLHFASGPTGSEGVIPVAVVARELMDKWTAMLLEYGIQARYLVAETMALPVLPDRWSLYLADNSFILRKGIRRGWAGDLDTLPIYLGEEETPAPAAKLINLFMAEDGGDLYKEIIPEDRVAAISHQPLVEIISANFNEKQAINLLQGDYSLHAGRRDLWNNWQIPIVAAILLGVLSLIGFGHDYFTLRKKNIALNDRVNAVYLKAFPDSRRVVNARVQMEQKLVELEQNVGERNSFFAIYDQMAPLLLNAPGFVVSNFRYNNGRFDIDIDIKDLQALDKLKVDLVATLGDIVDIKNAEAVNQVVKAKIQIRADEKQ